MPFLPLSVGHLSGHLTNGINLSRLVTPIPYKPKLMKKTFTKIIALACCLMSTSAFAQLTPEVLYYKFDGTGTSVPNLASAPTAPTATIMGGVTQGGNTLCQGSLIGTGVSSTTDYLNTGWNPNLGTGSWTISFRTSGISTNATLYYIFGDANTNSFRCFTNGIAGSTNWVIRGANIVDTYINGGALNTPTMCTYVYDSGALQMRAYLNGVLVSTVAQTGVNLTGTGPLKVMGYGSNVGAPAGGLMDEYRLYSRALTAAEVAQLNNPFTPSGFTGSDVAFCTGASVTLNIGNWPYTTAAWSNGSTTDTAMVMSPGTYIVSMSGSCGSGNDTIIVNDTRTSATMNAIICGGSYTAPSGAVYSVSGTYMDTIPNVALCDSLITINLVNGAPTTSSMSVSSCYSYTAPSGAVVTTSGTFNDTIANYLGCDSIITISLTINTATQYSFAVTSCGMYTTPSGMMIMSSGTVQDTIPNAAGCDSAMTIGVTILQSSTSTWTGTACGMYTAPSGAVFMASGTYMDTIANMAGCDSVITINLTINNSSFAGIGATACDSYTAPSGAVFTTSGLWNDTITNMAGCDSIIQINLVVFNSTNSTMNVSACNSFTAPSGAVLTTSGTYMDTIPNMAGCDSVITIGLQITPLDTSVTLVGLGTLQATQTGATYQWLDCNNGMSPVAGATTQMWTPSQNGIYCCVVTNGACSDTSGCHTAEPVGIDENAFAAGITLYPNPNSGNFNINLGATYSDVTVVITDLAGRIVYSHIENSTNMIPVQLDAAAGTYVIIVTSGANQATFRMNKQ